MDVSMPGMDGFKATRIICERLPQIKVLMLTHYASNENYARAVSAGAAGYVLKDSAVDEIDEAVRAVMGGVTYFGAGVTNPLEIPD
jgi:HlyD family secretion protein